MPNIILAYDHLDNTIGTNCYQCYLHLDKEIALSSYKTQVLDGGNCSSQKLQECITSLNGQAFIFIAYSHGKEDALLSCIEPSGYVTTGNAYFFGQSLVYTNSCHSALQLKNELIKSNCLGFVGYEDIVRLPENSDDERIFISCENRGIIHFLTTNDNLFESVQIMKEYYQEEYVRLASRNFFLASRLLRNMEALVIAGNFNLTKNDLL